MNVALSSKFVITDSGGLQEETTYLNIPCLTLRENTERPVTITQGTNRLVRAETMAENVSKILAGNWPSSTCPPLWDGQAAVRDVACLKRRVQSQKEC
jgi:UDP-N-acetylglucosamine 2-epimerase (non-hydrolysing)